MYRMNRVEMSYESFIQEDIAGWEKAKAEAALRKQDLGEELHQKIAERVNFYKELKDRILQLSYVRNEEDKRMHEAMVKASRELEKRHAKLESERSRMVADLSLENSRLAKALLLKEKLTNDASEKMTQVTREYDILMAKQDSTEKENGFLRCELQMLEKELNIRNKELEQKSKSADVLEKKYSESTNKIRKLEAECQSLRVLVRKRLPGPTTSTKMKTEVKVQRRVPRKVLDRRISLLIERAFDVEEENKILKEVAGSKDEEFRSLKNAFDLLNSKFSQIEDQLVESPESQKSVKECDSFDLVSTDHEKASDWLQNVVEVILEHTHVSKRKIDEILEDIRLDLKLYTDNSETTIESEASKLLPLRGIENQVEESELARLKLDLENLQELKRLSENQLEHQKLINEELDTQLTVSKVQLNELLHNLSSLEVKLKDKSYYCKELEAAYFDLHVQLESVSSKGVVEEKEKHYEEMFETDREVPVNFDRVLSKRGDKTSTLHASLRDRILAEEGVNFVEEEEDDDPNSPQTKEIILHSSNGHSLNEVRTNVPGAVTIFTNKKRSGGSSLLRRLLSRRKKGLNKKKSTLTRGKSL